MAPTRRARKQARDRSRPASWPTTSCSPRISTRSIRRRSRTSRSFAPSSAVRRCTRRELNTLDEVRRAAVARTLFAPTTLQRALDRLGFVQADPIRAPARAQDLTLRHRVTNYRAGDLERRYPRLPIEEDFFINYGFVPRELHALMHPRTARQPWTKVRWKRAHDVLGFVREKGVVHPRQVDAHFEHGKTTNWF